MIIRPIKECDTDSIERINNAAPSKIFVGRCGAHVSGKEIFDSLTDLDHMLVMEDESRKRVVAIILVAVDGKVFLRRMARLRICVEPESQGKGLGRILMKAALDLAEKELMMERVEVEVPTSNVNALKLCKLCGFKVEGIAKDWLVTDDGKYIDSYLMAHYPVKK